MSGVRPAVLLQGPVLDAGAARSTVAVLDGINAAPSRSAFHLAFVAWDTQDAEQLRQVEKRVDQLVLARPPARAGRGNRWLQATGVQAGLSALRDDGVTHVLKSRADIALSEALLSVALEHFGSGGRRLLVTDLWTRLEPFHLSDLVVGSTLRHVGDYFSTAPTYYEDAFSPEVQFTRSFVRHQHLRYTMRLESWLRFLVDWVELVDFAALGLRWLKHAPTTPRRVFPYGLPALVDRDAGPLLCTPVRPAFVHWLRTTSLPMPLVATLIRSADPLVEAALLALPDTARRRLDLPFHRYTVTPGVLESMLDPLPDRP